MSTMDDAKRKLQERIKNKMRSMSVKLTTQNNRMIVSQTVSNSTNNEIITEFSTPHKSTAVGHSKGDESCTGLEPSFEVQGEWLNCKMDLLVKNTVEQLPSSVVLDLTQTDRVKKQFSAAIDRFLSTADLRNPFGIRLIFDDTNNETVVSDDQTDKTTNSVRLDPTASDERSLSSFDSSPTATLRLSHSIHPSFTTSSGYYCNSVDETERRLTCVKDGVSPPSCVFSCMETMHRSTLACLCPTCLYARTDYYNFSHDNMDVCGSPPARSPLLEVVDDSEFDSESVQSLDMQGLNISQQQQLSSIVLEPTKEKLTKLLSAEQQQSKEMKEKSVATQSVANTLLSSVDSTSMGYSEFCVVPVRASSVVGLTNSATIDGFELTVVLVNDRTKCTQATSAHDCSDQPSPVANEMDISVNNRALSRDVLIQVGPPASHKD